LRPPKSSYGRSFPNPVLPATEMMTMGMDMAMGTTE
jgi:hypothetical protein